jgi:hypothetical protein
MAVDTSGKKKFAFRDVRDTAELLASGRPPKSLSFSKNNPASSKLGKLANKLKGNLTASLKSQAISIGLKAALGPVGGAIAGKVLGKFKLFGGKKLTGGIGTATKAASSAALGVSIVEESNPDNIRRPLKEGLSASASAAGKSLSETVARSVAQSLVSGAPLGAGIPTLPREFKTASALVSSPRFFNPKATKYTLDSKEKTTAEKAVKYVVISTPEERLYPQSGLLEDEIMYRLTLLAENVYAPTRNYAQSSGLGVPYILEGFRSETTGTSQHERGEAIDITVGDGSLAAASSLYQLARWMRDNILYDQLILCYDISGGGQAWIHVSFSIDARRRQVQTKTFNDTFVDGLHIYQPSTGTDTQAQRNIEAGTKLLDMLAERQQRLQPVGLDTQLPQEQPVSILSASAGAGGSSDGGGGGACEGVVFPAPGTDPTNPYYWELPPGISIDPGYLRQAIRNDIYNDAALRLPDGRPIDIDTEEGRAALSCSGEPFSVDGWVGYSSKPDTLSDGRWVIGWQGYWLARIENAYNSKCSETGSADPRRCSSANVIDPKWTSKWPCNGGSGGGKGAPS